jgi:hypothetical protein
MNYKEGGKGCLIFGTGVDNVCYERMTPYSSTILIEKPESSHVFLYIITGSNSCKNGAIRTRTVVGYGGVMPCRLSGSGVVSGADNPK